MPYRSEFVDEAKFNLRVLRKGDQVKVLDKIETHLAYQPTLQSKSRIKSLRPGTFPPYRLRVDEFRVYYDVIDSERLVVIYGIVPKTESAAWLDRSSKDHRKEQQP
jgi:mRNA-degrading endonuclease RelE of RelBE toxin-antitoxin system